MDMIAFPFQPIFFLIILGGWTYAVYHLGFSRGRLHEQDLINDAIVDDKR